MNPTNQNQETTDVDKVIVKMSKDIEYLKQKVVELESEKMADYLKVTVDEAKEQFVEPAPSRVGLARGSRPLLESEIKEALLHVECASAAARYLNVSYKTYKKYASKYGLFKANPQGKGALKRVHDVNVGRYPLDKILAGEITHRYPWKLKNLLFRAKLKQKVCERCGWKEARGDGTVPLVINFSDGNPEHQVLDNIKIYCHNCTFCLRGYVRRGMAVFDEETME